MLTKIITSSLPLLVFCLMLAAIYYVPLSRVAVGQTFNSDFSLSPSDGQGWFVAAKRPALDIGGMRHKTGETDYPLAYVTALRSTLKGKALSSVTLARRGALHKLYAQRDYHPIWTRLDHKPSSGFKSLVKRLKNSWTHGLNPDQYRVQLLQELAQEDAPSAVAMREIMASNALIRYVSDLIGPRIIDREKGHTIYGWREPVAPVDILRKIGGGRDLDNMINSRLPDSRTYKKMQATMRELVRQYRYDKKEKNVEIAFEGILRPGDSHDAVRQIRKRLDVPARHNRPDHVYGDPLAMAVKAFQARNGLDTDAIVGPATRAAMNRTEKDKIEQLIANMQRMRWLAPDRPDRYVIVNIPAARLWAVDSGRVVHRMGVIAGRPSRETVSFVTQAEGVRFNPKWSIPYTIKFRDILPEIRKDTSYLSENNIKLVQGYGRNARRLHPKSVDWDEISDKRLARMRMIQEPGEKNPLGHIRILMPNRFGIFLHDTDKPKYFDKGRSWISSGCVRMRDPEKIADFVMNTTGGWSQAKMQRLLNGTDPVDLESDEKIPVYILYHTIWQRGDGELVYGPDIYNRDDALVTKLREANQIYIPSKQEVSSPEEGTMINAQHRERQENDNSLTKSDDMRLLSPEDPA